MVLVPLALTIGSGRSANPKAASLGGHGSDVDSPVSGVTVPEPVQPAFTPGVASPLPGQGHVSLWSPVRTTARARALPNPHSPVVARLATRTPEGTSNLVTVIGRRVDSRGRVWVQARLPVLPNDTTGWVPRKALGGYVAVRTHLYVDLDQLTARLERNGRTVFEASIGVGTASAPTPTGRFYIRNKLTSYRSPMYGPVAFGTSARSAILTDWPAGGFVGIHGTDQPELLPGRVSHGCIRLPNPDILRLARLMPVGTPVTIR